MFRYVQDCPDCQCSGRTDNATAICSRCNGIGSLIVTETIDRNGTLILDEVPDSAGSAYFRNYQAIEVFEDAVYDINALECKLPTYINFYDFDFADEISSGGITDSTLMHQIPKERGMVLGLRHHNKNEFLIILGSYGFYLPAQDGYFYTLYEQIIEVWEKEDRLVITCGESDQDNNAWDLEILRTPENDHYLRSLRLTLKRISDGTWTNVPDILLLNIHNHLKNHSGKIAQNGKEYLFEFGSHLWRPKYPAEKKIRQVLFSYAAKIRRPFVAMLIDVSLDDANNKGIVFAQDGFAFCNDKNYGYIPYESVRFITTNPQKTTLTLHGNFDECWHRCKKVSFSSKEYHIDRLEDCFQDLLRLV